MAENRDDERKVELVGSKGSTTGVVVARAALTKERLAAKRDEAPALAQVDAVEARKELALSARFARKLTTGFLAELVPLPGWVKKLAERATAENSASMDAAQALAAMREVAAVIGRVVDLASRAQSMENLALGGPTEVVGVMPMDQEVPMNSEEIVREVGAALRSVARALRDGSVKPCQAALRALVEAASTTVVLFESMDGTVEATRRRRANRNSDPLSHSRRGRPRGCHQLTGPCRDAVSRHPVGSVSLGA